MATDLFGKPLGGKAAPEFKLNLQQKRQAALLYHWMSLDNLKGLKHAIEVLIKGADANLDLAQQQGRDALLTNERWGVRDTSANWSTYAFPALEDFRKATIKDIARRASESYEFTGLNQCSRMLHEFSSMWMTPEEEERFGVLWKKVVDHAQYIDFAAGVGGRRHQLHDRSMALSYWPEFAHLFPRLPKFRVRTDVQGTTGKRPARTGVYVPQDDELGTLQFAWTGNEDGVLGEAQTLNDYGRRLVSLLGRDAMWVDGKKMAAYATDAFKRGELTDYDGFPPGSERDPEIAAYLIYDASRATRPCKWYFVEKVEGEFDDEEPVAAAATTGGAERLRCEGGQPCPQAGFWSTPAQANSRRKFAAGEPMPVIKDSPWGTTIWQWDDNQT